MGRLTLEGIRRAKPFAMSYNWHIEFVDFGSSYFPCHTFNETPFSFENAEVEYGPYTFPYPSKAGRGSIDVELYEFDDYSVLKWLESWFKLIRKTNYGIALLDEAKREVTIAKFNMQGQPIFTNTFYVIPDGEISYSYGSDKDQILSVTLNMRIVGT